MWKRKTFRIGFPKAESELSSAYLGKVYKKIALLTSRFRQLELFFSSLGGGGGFMDLSLFGLV